MLENDFNSFASNPIIINSIGFAPKLYEFHFLAKYYDNSAIIEEPVLNLAKKYSMQKLASDIVNIVDNAIDLDGNFRKDQEKSNIEDLRVTQKGGD